MFTTVSIACNATSGGDSKGGDTPDMSDAGPTLDRCDPSNDYGPALMGMEGDDDDCKYHIVVTKVEGSEHATTVTIKVTYTTNGMPVLDAAPRAEVYLNCMHGEPNATAIARQPVDMGGGVYKLGPIDFDQKGQWRVRFHFFESCTADDAKAPHGHAAFLVNAP
jgi:hypothetical protein